MSFAPNHQSENSVRIGNCDTRKRRPILGLNRFCYDVVPNRYVVAGSTVYSATPALNLDWCDCCWRRFWQAVPYLSWKNKRWQLVTTLLFLVWEFQQRNGSSRYNLTQGISQCRLLNRCQKSMVFWQQIQSCGRLLIHMSYQVICVNWTAGKAINLLETTIL